MRQEIRSTNSASPIVCTHLLAVSTSGDFVTSTDTSRALFLGGVGRARGEEVGREGGQKGREGVRTVWPHRR